MDGKELLPLKDPRKTFDDILTVVGSFGRYQILVTFLVLLPVVLPSGFLAMSSVFLGATPARYWCTVPNNTVSNPLQWTSNKTGRNCKMFRNGISLETSDSGTTDNLSIILMNSTYDEESTSCLFGVDFDHSVYQETVVTEWDLVCERRKEGVLTFSAYVVGGIIGPLIWGVLADRIGRRKGFYLCVLFQSAAAIATGFASSYMWFMFCRLCVGMTSSAAYTIPFVLTLEITEPEKRALLSVLLSTTYSIGCLIFLATAYLVRAWRNLALISSVVGAVIYAASWWFLPESPRWLLSRGKFSELESFLRKIAFVNGRSLAPDFSTALPEALRSIDKGNHQRAHSPLDLFRTPNMCRKTLTLILINTCNKGVSLGLNYYSPQFASNDPYWSAFLNTVVELPPYLFAKFSFQTLGRRTSLFLGLFVAGASCLSAYAVPSHLAWLILTLSLVGKFCITFTYLSGKLFEDETFPTVVRSEGHSMVSVVSSAATCGVPFIVDLGHDSRTLPLVIFGSLCCFASFSTFCLPETLHQRLPQTIQDGEEFGKYMTWKERFRMIPRKKIVANGFAVKELDRLNPSTT